MPRGRGATVVVIRAYAQHRPVIGRASQAVIAGSNWNNATNCSSQARNANNQQSNTNSNISCHAVTVKHQGGPSPSGDGRNWVHFPVYFRGALHTYLTCQIHLLYVLGHLRHPRGKPFDADPVRLCQTLARKGAVETRFEAVFGRSEASVPARQEPLRFVGACRLAWRSDLVSDFGTDQTRAAESPSPSGRGSLQI